MYPIPDSKVHGANMGPTWALPAPDGPMLAPWTLLSGIHSLARLTMVQQQCATNIAVRAWCRRLPYQYNTHLAWGHIFHGFCLRLQPRVWGGAGYGLSYDGGKYRCSCWGFGNTHHWRYVTVHNKWICIHIRTKRYCMTHRWDEAGGVSI